MWQNKKLHLRPETERGKNKKNFLNLRKTHADLLPTTPTQNATQKQKMTKRARTAIALGRSDPKQLQCRKCIALCVWRWKGGVVLRWEKSVDAQSRIPGSAAPGNARLLQMPIPNAQCGMPDSATQCAMSNARHRNP